MRKVNEVREVRLSELTSFPESPFKTRNGPELELLRESIRANGVIVPLIVRPEEGGYQIISGQRRADVCRELGMESVPVIVKELDRDAAVILFVDSNISRDQLLPSEKAFAYRMKLEAVKHQRAQLGYRGKSIEYLARFSPESRTQIQRFIRLTELEKPLLDLVDEGRIALTPAVELSYLSKPEQCVLIEAIESEQGTPTLSQAVRLRDLSRGHGAELLRRVGAHDVALHGAPAFFARPPGLYEKASGQPVGHQPAARLPDELAQSLRLRQGAPVVGPPPLGEDHDVAARPDSAHHLPHGA